MNDLWITWTGVAHLAARGVAPGDVRSGDFPLACGRWAPSGFDADVHVASGSAKRCGRCSKISSSSLSGSHNDGVHSPS
jgi:hypothetical protein